MNCVDDSTVILNENIDGNNNSNSNNKSSERLFKFDKCFNMGSSQSQVFKEVSELVQSCMDGYRVCVFSYGQTGSGKTHTMTGDVDGNSDNHGIIPRSVLQVLESASVLRSMGWTVDVEASVVELYNEELRDLLASNTTSTNIDTKDKLKISFINEKVSVSGLVKEKYSNTGTAAGMLQLKTQLSRASRNRTTAATGMNNSSSRSHVLYMLDVHMVSPEGAKLIGGLRLVDLAGSERLNRTGTAADSKRLKETVNINKSLSCLADVFQALGKKNSHIPYRNSKLTMLLQDCLSGDGKALMFVNVSPTIASVLETLCSLRFAKQVSQIEFGKASRNISYTNTHSNSCHGSGAREESKLTIDTSSSNDSSNSSSTTTTTTSKDTTTTTRSTRTKRSNSNNNNSSSSSSSSGPSSAVKRSRAANSSSSSSSSNLNTSSSGSWR